MKTHIQIVFISLLTCISVYSQSLDSLNRKLTLAKTSKDSLVLYQEICTANMRNRTDAKAGIKENVIFAALAHKEKNYEAESMAFRFLSSYYMDQFDSEHSLSNIRKALNISKKNCSLKTNLLNYNQLGRVFQHFQDYKSAVSSYEEGFKLYDGSNISVVSTMYFNLGSAYQSLGNTDKALECNGLGLKFSEKFGTTDNISYANYSVAYALMENAKYDQAEHYFLRAMNDSLKLKNKAYIYNAHHSIAINYSRWGKFKKAEQHNVVALKYFRETGNKLYEYDVLNNMASLYARMADIKKTIAYGEAALSLAKKLNHSRAIAGTATTLLRAYIEKKDIVGIRKIIPVIDNNKEAFDHRDNLSKIAYNEAMAIIEKDSGNYSKSLASMRKSIAYRDSLHNQQLSDKTEELMTRFEVQKKENEILKLSNERNLKELELVSQKRNTQFLLVGLLLFLCLLIVIFYFYRKTRKQRDYIQTLNSEIHHRVKNNLSIISSFIDIAKEDSDDATTEKLGVLQNRVNSIYEVHKLLIETGASKEYVDFIVYIDKLIKNIQGLYDSSKVTIKKDIGDKVRVDQAQIFPLGLIVNEFITNSIKHGGKTNDKLQINMSHKEKSMVLKLTDNGRGLPVDFNPLDSPGYGIRLINLLSKQLDGEYTWSTNDGLTFTLEFPNQ